MTWHLDLDRLEICHCGRLICDTPDCDVLRKLGNGTFYSHDDRGERDQERSGPALTVDEYRGRYGLAGVA
jgi:hypothetical protein